MGIESISNVAGAQGFQGQSAEVPQKKVQSGNDSVSNVQIPQASVVNQSVTLGSLSEEGKQGSISDSQKENQQDESVMKNAAKDINKLINHNTVAEFGYHEATKRITIKIKDKDTNEVIKEIPTEKALEMLEKAWEIAGILVDEKR